MAIVEQDLAISNASENSSSVSILMGNGDGTFEPAQDFGVGNFAASIAIGDFNGDGREDLATANNDFGPNNPSKPCPSCWATAMAPSHPHDTLRWGRFPFQSSRETSMAMAVRIWPPPMADAYSVSILLGNGDGTFQPARDFALAVCPVVRSPLFITVADFNGDSQQDLATANNVDFVSILPGNGDGTFEPAQDFGVGPFSSINHRGRLQ